MSDSTSRTCQPTSGMHLTERTLANAIAEIGEPVTR